MTKHFCDVCGSEIPPGEQIGIGFGPLVGEPRAAPPPGAPSVGAAMYGRSGVGMASAVMCSVPCAVQWLHVQARKIEDARRRG